MDKSSYHYVNRSTYSGQKQRHLIKFMSLVFLDGYVLEIIGSFDGVANDAAITHQIIETRNQLVQWCDVGDVMVCDRGFRDAIQSLTNLGYKIQSPVYLKRSKKQHTTEDANESQIVTEVYWTAESYHGRMKKWRMLSD